MRTHDRLEPMKYDTSSARQERRLNIALYVPCSLVQLARVVVCVRVHVDVLGVMVVLLIAHTVDVVSAVLVAIFVVIFCNWRCTLVDEDSRVRVKDAYVRVYKRACFSRRSLSHMLWCDASQDHGLCKCTCLVYKSD